MPRYVPGARATMLVIGATSELAVATIKEFMAAYPQTAWHLHLLGRNEAALAALAAKLGPAQVSWDHYDTALAPETQQACVCKAVELLGRIDYCLCAVGYLGSQQRAEREWQEAQRITDANYRGLLPVLDQVACCMEQARCGQLLVISSVAGERGRRSNYYYGAAKAALSTYLSGLRLRLLPSGMLVMTIKPGYVRTRMVAGRKLPPYISPVPEVVARDIVKAARRGQPVLYSMWLWRYIMALTRLIPERIFMHLRRF